jgi:hypothetical protein
MVAEALPTVATAVAVEHVAETGQVTDLGISANGKTVREESSATLIFRVAPPRMGSGPMSTRFNSVEVMSSTPANMGGGTGVEVMPVGKAGGRGRPTL